MLTLGGIYLFHLVLYTPSGIVVSSITLCASATVKATMSTESQIYLSLKPKKEYLRIVDCKLHVSETRTPFNRLDPIPNHILPIPSLRNVAIFIPLQQK